MKGIKEKMIAGSCTIGFMALITTNGNPKMWQIAMLSLALYEVALIAVRIARKQAYVSQKRKYITASKINAKRWSETRLSWPMREVS